MKKLILVVLLALFAGACGGSDDAEPAAIEADVVQEDVSDGDGTDVEDDGDPAPSPILIDPITNRDCAHTAAELEDTVEEVEVELPPAVKPVVDDEYLGSFDELISTDLIVGSGEEATAGVSVEMQYVGVLGVDGTEFDASWNTGQPFAFTLGSGQVISGWDEGIEGMLVGGRRVLQIPSEQAYGDQDRSELIVADSDLVFIVDLIGIAPAPEPSPPIDDENLGSFGELQIVELVEGNGCTAEIGDIVLVNYVGVDAVEGEEFDSSWGRGEPFEIIVGRSQVIEGWNDGIEGMKVGGERILQIPSAQAYDEGDLVFRVHLEELIEAPFAHQIEFDGPAPSELEVTTLIEGSGDEAVPGSIVDANIVVMLYKSGVIVQSTWQQGITTQLSLSEGSLLPGLEESVIGTKVGETRQIIVPPEVAYPNGDSQLEADDALVFIVEPLRVIGG